MSFRFFKTHPNCACHLQWSSILLCISNYINFSFFSHYATPRYGVGLMGNDKWGLMSGIQTMQEVAFEHNRPSLRIATFFGVAQAMSESSLNHSPIQPFAQSPFCNRNPSSKSLQPRMSAWATGRLGCGWNICMAIGWLFFPRLDTPQ